MCLCTGIATSCNIHNCGREVVMGGIYCMAHWHYKDRSHIGITFHPSYDIETSGGHTIAMNRKMCKHAACTILEQCCGFCGLHHPPQALHESRITMEEDNKKFYMITGRGERGPLVQRKTYIEAETEATRLARLNHGKPFYILTAVKSVVFNPDPVKITNLF